MKKKNINNIGYDEVAIYIFAGIECIMKRENGVWFEKTSHCNNCGKCCMNVPDEWTHGKDMKSGNCQHLIYRANEWLCKLGSHRPFLCCTGDGWPDACNIKWNEC